jgi:hypothetical protein
VNTSASHIPATQPELHRTATTFSTTSDTLCSDSNEPLMEFQDVYSNPEKKAEYSRMAIEENAQPAEAALVSLPKKQKKVLDDM